MSADPNQLQAQIDALNARRQMAMEMAQQPGMQQQVVNGRVMDQGFAPAIQGIARLISQGRAAQMGDKIAQLSGQVNAAKQQRADAAMRDLLGGDQQQSDPMPPSAPQASATSVASMFKQPEMSGSSMPASSPNMPLPPTAPRPMDSFLPNLVKAQRYINAGGNPVIADAFLKQNAVENKPEKPAVAPHYTPTVDGLFFDSVTNQYRDPDGKVLNAQQVKEWKTSLAGNRAAATFAATGGQDRFNNQQDRTNMKDAQSLRKEFDTLPSVKEYRTVLPLFNRAKTAPDTRAGDISMIYALGKMFDPNSVVREGELKLSETAAPWLQQMSSAINSQITGKGRINPETRKQIMDSLSGQVDSLKMSYGQDYDRFSKYAESSGFKPFDVVGDRFEKAFEQPSGAPKAVSWDSLK